MPSERCDENWLPPDLPSTHTQRTSKIATERNAIDVACRTVLLVDRRACLPWRRSAKQSDVVDGRLGYRRLSFGTAHFEALVWNDVVNQLRARYITCGKASSSDVRTLLIDRADRNESIRRKLSGRIDSPFLVFCPCRCGEGRERGRLQAMQRRRDRGEPLFMLNGKGDHK